MSSPTQDVVHVIIATFMSEGCSSDAHTRMLVNDGSSGAKRIVECKDNFLWGMGRDVSHFIETAKRVTPGVGTRVQVDAMVTYHDDSCAPCGCAECCA